jgi:hypothetical protein
MHTVNPASSASSAVEQIEFKEPWAGSLSPQNVLSAYSLSGVPAPAVQQTLALVDAYDDPTAEHDLKVFDEKFQLPPCTTANGCFSKVTLGSPATEPGWAQEIATDIEVAHSVCQSCKILLVEANTAGFPDLEAAEEIAAKSGGIGTTEISNSWGGPECSEGPSGLECLPDSPAFDHPGIVITAAAGDTGYLDWDAEELSEQGFADYPASSPHVVAVGGTRLNLTAGGTWKEEAVWNGSGAGGGGCSTVLTAPAWQQGAPEWLSVGCGKHRAVADVSADADPYTGVAVYDSTPITEGEVEYRGWGIIGGTSVASPIIAATFALAGGTGTGAGGKAIEYPAQTLYENLVANPGSLHDVVSGSNGTCAKGFNENTGISECTLAEEDTSCLAKAICLARKGYDGPSGVGTPNGIAAFKPQNEEEKQREEKRLTEEKQRKERQREEQEREERQREEKRKAEELGVGSGGGSTTGAGGNIGAGGSVSAGAGLTSGVGGGKASEKEGSSTLTIKLSAFALTPRALLALNRVQPKVSAVGFAFTLSAATRIHATLAKRVRVRGRNQWERLPADSLAFTAAKGGNHGRLANRGGLTPGRYRLTLTPQHGSARSLIFQIG